MTSLDDKFKTVPKPVHAPSGPIPTVVQATKKNSISWKLFGIWAWSPIISFQVGLTAGYLALIYFGFSALIASPPSIEMTTPDGYAWAWALALMVGAVIAAFGSVNRKPIFEHLERAGSSILTLIVGSYASIMLWLAYGTGDIDRVAGGAGFVALLVPIMVRCMWLWSQVLRPRAFDRPKKQVVRRIVAAVTSK